MYSIKLRYFCVCDIVSLYDACYDFYFVHTVFGVVINLKEKKDIIVCDGDYGVGAYGMEWVHNRDSERRRITS